MAKLLIVDDNADGRETLAVLLRRRGYETATAADGQAALDASVAGWPDLVLMDMSMPVMDGWEATRRLRSRPATADVPVLALTAHVTAGDRERALAAGCTDHHPKPMQFDRLFAQVEALLAGR